MPVLARLCAEAATWGPDEPIDPWWDEHSGSWRGVRSGVSRPSALRSLVLYPTNALVEDQIARLRRAIRHASGLLQRQLWFGRYTGASLGGGDLPSGASSRDRVRDVAAQMRAAVSEFDELRSVDGLDLSQFPDPRQGEMIARWDMIASPPDVMVTNYSMLNVMLMRDIEEPLFTATRDWLASEPTNVFTLVVDELHLYRGTQGAEVAMIVRNLLDRLGLEADSSQLRCVATSASLTDDEEGLGFLEQFLESSVHRSLSQPAPHDSLSRVPRSIERRCSSVGSPPSLRAAQL